MPRPLTTLAFMAAMTLASSASRADPCDDLLAQIDARIRATGRVNFTLTLADSAAVLPGRSVGSCGRGTRKIMYGAGEGSTPGVLGNGAGNGTGSATASAVPPSPFKTQVDGILTECKDGSIAYGPDCRKPPPVVRRVVANAASAASSASAAAAGATAVSKSAASANLSSKSAAVNASASNPAVSNPTATQQASAGPVDSGASAP